MTWINLHVAEKATIAVTRTSTGQETRLGEASLVCYDKSGHQLTRNAWCMHLCLSRDAEVFMCMESELHNPDSGAMGDHREVRLRRMSPPKFTLGNSPDMCSWSLVPLVGVHTMLGYEFFIRSQG